MVFAGLLAGGKGERVGSATAKQFLELDGRPMVSYPLELFCSLPEVDRVIVACNPNYMATMESIVSGLSEGATKVRMVPGGVTRHESVMNILHHIFAGNITPEDKLILHEAARPLIDAETVHAHIQELQTHEATNTLFPVVDTIMLSDDGIYIREVVDKKKSFIGQNPQGYVLTKLLERLGGDIDSVHNPDDIDLCGLFMNNGGKVKIVKGNERLFKVTYPSDLDLLHRFISGGRPA